MAEYSSIAKENTTVQRAGSTARNGSGFRLEDKRPLQRKSNHTGLPDQLKSGIENLSGHSMDDVKVHYNSAQPAQLNAHAYAQGSNIHLAPGQEKHLPHEAWHVVQQKQGRVKPTKQLKSKFNINDDEGLEKEADSMGAKAMQRMVKRPETTLQTKSASENNTQLLRRDQKKRNKNKKKKKNKNRNKNRNNQNQQGPQQQATASGTEFSLVEHYMHKLPHLFDLLTSFRRQRMLVTSTLTRTYLHYMKTPAQPYIDVSKIKLLHPNSLEDTKTKKRYEIILKYITESKNYSLSAGTINKLIPSDEAIQVAKISDSEYISLQGVGRIVALREAAKEAGITLNAQLDAYDLTTFPLIPGQMDAISKSYGFEESAISKAALPLLMTIGIDYFTGGNLASFATWLATTVYGLMEKHLAPSSGHSGFSYPKGGTRFDE